MSSRSMAACHDQGLTLSTAYTEYSIYWVLYTPRTAFSQVRLSPNPSQSLISRQTMLYSILYIPKIKSYPVNRVSGPIAPHSRTTASRLNASRLTASKSSSNTAWSKPPNTPPISLDHSLQVHLQTPCATASKCISQLVPAESLSPSPSSLDPGSMCISKHTLLRPHSASPYSLNHGIGVYLWGHKIMVRWNGGARRQTAHHNHSAAPCMPVRGNSWGRVVLARGMLDEIDRIQEDTLVWWTTQIAWTNERLARVPETKSSARYRGYYV